PGPEGGADAAGVLGPAASGQDTDGGIARGVVHLGAQQQRNLVEIVEGGTRARHAARETQTDQNLDGMGETDRCHDGTLFFAMSFWRAPLAAALSNGHHGGRLDRKSVV